MEIIPCEDCLLIPICRHKSFPTLLIECQILKEFDDKHMERDQQDYFISITAIEEALTPTAWEYRNSKNRNPFILKEVK